MKRLIILSLSILCLTVLHSQSVLATEYTPLEFTYDDNSVFLDSDIEILQVANAVVLGEDIEITLKVTNTGQIIWPIDNQGHIFNLLIKRVYYEEYQNNLIDFLYFGTSATNNIAPGESAVLSFRIPTAGESPINIPGKLIIETQMLKNDKAWFGDLEQIEVELGFGYSPYNRGLIK